MDSYHFAEKVTEIGEEETIYWDTNQGIHYHDHSSHGTRWRNVSVTYIKRDEKYKI